VEIVAVLAHAGGLCGGAHIADDTTYFGSVNLGATLRARYGASCLTIGTTLYQGRFTAYLNYPSVEDIPLLLLTNNNDDLGQVGLPLYMLDLRTLPSGPIADWAKGSGSAATLLELGLQGQRQEYPGLLSQWFDVIVHVQNTTAAEHF
jgi:hypothetical protein